MIQECSIPSGSPPLPRLDVAQDIPNEIVGFLNGGGSLDELLKILSESAQLPNWDSAFTVEDLDGDGYLDQIVTILNPTPEAIQAEGMLLLLTCQGAQYELAFLLPVVPGWSVPIVLSIEDLNNDCIADLTVGRETCGAHTCFTDIQFITWTGSHFENRFEGSSQDIPSPIIEIVLDPKHISVTAGGINSVGAGPYRSFIRRWAWDPDLGLMAPSKDELLPAEFRIHKLLDAEESYLQEDFNQALILYRQVIESEDLLDWIDPTVEQANLGAYALFRIMLTHIISDQLTDAESAYKLLVDSFNSEGPGFAYAEMGRTFWEVYQETSKAESACATARAYASTHPEAILDPLYFGYTNPTYSPEDICPEGL